MQMCEIFQADVYVIQGDFNEIADKRGSILCRQYTCTYIWFIGKLDNMLYTDIKVLLFVTIITIIVIFKLYLNYNNCNYSFLVVTRIMLL